MRRLHRTVLFAGTIALCAPLASFAHDARGTGVPTQTLHTLELNADFGRRGEVRSAARGRFRMTGFDRIAFDPQGRIVVTGSGTVRGSDAYRPCVARYLANGRLDRSFAGGIVALPV